VNAETVALIVSMLPQLIDLLSKAHTGSTTPDEDAKVAALHALLMGDRATEAADFAAQFSKPSTP
jgi:CO dehydrogenase/acetyl-CoA synthase alpha subunit